MNSFELGNPRWLLGKGIFPQCITLSYSVLVELAQKPVQSGAGEDLFSA